MSGASNERKPDGSGPVLWTSSATAIGWTTIAAAGFVALLILWQVPLQAAVPMLGLPALIAAVGWACYLRPRVVLDDRGARVVNLVRTFDLPFARISSVESRLGVTIETDDGRRVGVWSLPHSGRRTRRAGPGLVSRGVVEAHTGAEVQSLLDALARWRQADDGPVGPQEVTVQVHTLPVGLCGLAVLWAAWGLAVTSNL